MANCSALIGSGDVTIYSEYTIYSILLLSDITNTIIDNVSIDSQHDGNGQAHFLTNQGISLDGVSNTTINAVETYNNDYF
jgi:hypothetical protein